MNETKKNEMNYIGHVLGKVAIHTDFENLGVFFLRVMNETKKNAMNHIGHVLGKVAIHTDFENLGVFGPGDYTYIYTCVCVCVCVCIHIENLGVSVPEDYTHVVQCQKRPTTVSKETYYSVKRDLVQHIYTHV